MFDLEGFLGRDMGRASAGSSIPLSRSAPAPVPRRHHGQTWSPGGSVATGGSLITLDYEDLVDMVYGVAEQYLIRVGRLADERATAGSFRKLRDGAGGTVGAVLWEPSLTAGIQGGEPDRLLGYPVYYDSNVAAQGSAAKAAWFGDFSSYYVRQAGNVPYRAVERLPVQRRRGGVPGHPAHRR